MPEGTAYIEDVTLRDGLQGERRLVPIAEKLQIVKGLIAAGVRRIQVGSFVHPEKVPQMANTDALCGYLPSEPKVTYTALVLNEAGLARAMKSGIHHLYMAISATESHNLENNHCTLQEARQRIGRMICRAKSENLFVRAGIMMAFGCAFEGPVEADRIVEMACRYASLGADIIDLADTAALAGPRQVYDLVSRAKAETGLPVSLHLHGSRDRVLENMRWGLRAGAILFDTSIAALGGCPFIPHAEGNLDTEAAVRLLQAEGIHPEIDGRKLRELRRTLSRMLQHPLA